MTENVDSSWNEVLQLQYGLQKILSEVGDLVSGNVVVFGAGRTGKTAIRYLKKMGLRNLFFSDNDQGKQGTVVGGVSVVGPRDHVVSSAKLVLIASRYAVNILRHQLNRINVFNMSFDAFILLKNMDRVSRVRNDLLHDKQSKICYDAILKTIFTGDDINCASVMEGNQYFALPEFVKFGNDHFIDAGAFVGDTLEKYIWITCGHFKKYYAFEPGKTQIAAMRNRVERLSKEWIIPESAIICEQAGLSDKNEELSVFTDDVPGNTCLDALNKPSENPRVQCYTLDSYLNGKLVTFIKADIEGMELAMLHGARETIQSCKPKLALSVYHKVSDLFEIPEFVNQLMPDYRMAIRHHSPIFAETVLYCWIP